MVFPFTFQYLKLADASAGNVYVNVLMHVSQAVKLLYSSALVKKLLNNSRKLF